MQKVKSINPHYDFCVPIYIVFSQGQEEKVVELDVLGYFENINDSLVPSPLDFRISQVNSKKYLVPQPEIEKYISQFIPNNPVKVKGLILKSIQIFASECNPRRI
jgi:hypothetical protein